MEWLDGYVGSPQMPLKEAPEIFQSICMYAAIYILLGVVHNIMDIAPDCLCKLRKTLLFGRAALSVLRLRRCFEYLGFST
jgi:hypothetical protein